MGTASTILSVLDLIIAGTLTYERIKELRQRIADMQAEGRDPTADELTALLDEIASATADIVAADERLGG